MADAVSLVDHTDSEIEMDGEESTMFQVQSSIFSWRRTHSRSTRFCRTNTSRSSSCSSNVEELSQDMEGNTHATYLPPEPMTEEAYQKIFELYASAAVSSRCEGEPSFSRSRFSAQSRAETLQAFRDRWEECEVTPPLVTPPFATRGSETNEQASVKSNDGSYSLEAWALRRDMAKNKVRWYGIWYRDLCYFLANNHPVVAVFRSHPLHPIARWERIFVYFTMFIFKLMVACIVMEGKSCLHCGITSCGSEKSECYSSWGQSPSADTKDQTICLCNENGERYAALIPYNNLSTTGHHEQEMDSEEIGATTVDDYEGLVNEGAFAYFPLKLSDLRRSDSKIPPVPNFPKPHADLGSHQAAGGLFIQAGRPPLVLRPKGNYCCHCAYAGILWILSALTPHFGAVVYTIILGCTFAIFMFQMMGCFLAQDHSRRSRQRLEDIGHLVVGIITFILTFVLLPPLIKYCLDHQMLQGAMWTTVIAQLSTWCLSLFFVPGMCSFFFFYLIEKCRAARSDTPLFIICEDDYRELLQHLSHSGS